MKATANIPQYTPEQIAAMTDAQAMAYMNRKFVVKYPSGYEQGLNWCTSDLTKATKMSYADAVNHTMDVWKNRRIEGEILLIVE